MATEKRLIDADEFLKWVVKRFHCVPLVGSCGNDSESIKFLLSQAPTVDAVEVVHGRWEQARFTEAPLYICSECDKPEYKQHRYCPNCGAKMDGGNDNVN